MRITDCIKADGHPRARAKKIVFKIPEITGSYKSGEWSDIDKYRLNEIYIKHRNPSAKYSGGWLSLMWKEIYENDRNLWNKLWFFAQTPELLVVPELHIEAALGSAWCPVCTAQWIPSTQAWGCYRCSEADPSIRWRLRNSKSAETMMKNHGVSHPSHITGHSIKVKSTLRKNYGVENPMHDASIAMRSQESSFKRSQFSYNGRTFSLQGYEPHALRYLV
jgi:hypothetical protein